MFGLERKRRTVFATVFWLLRQKLKMPQKTPKFSKNAKKWKTMNFFEKLEKRSFKEVFRVLPKIFLKNFDNFWWLNLSGHIWSKKMGLFKTYNKTLYIMSPKKWTKKWTKMCPDRFRVHFLRQVHKKFFGCTLNPLLKLPFFNFLIECLVFSKIQIFGFTLKFPFRI